MSVVIIRGYMSVPSFRIASSTVVKIYTSIINLYAIPSILSNLNLATLAACWQQERAKYDFQVISLNAPPPQLSSLDCGAANVCFY